MSESYLLQPRVRLCAEHLASIWRLGENGKAMTAEVDTDDERILRVLFDDAGPVATCGKV